MNEHKGNIKKIEFMGFKEHRHQLGCQLSGIKSEQKLGSLLSRIPREQLDVTDEYTYLCML